MANRQQNTYTILGFLPEHWTKDESSNNYAFVYSFAKLAADYESEQSDLQDNLFIDTATGEYLDRKGELYGIFRDGLDDDDYRAKIIALNSSTIGGGITDSIKLAVSTTSGSDVEDITVTDYSGYNGIFDIEVEVDENFDPLLFNNVRDFVEDAKAAGTYFRELTVSSKDNVFRVDISTCEGIDYVL